ncbi:MAG TPA: hypothetical protein VGM16_11565 [Gammaproteobacteria bacterium]|jgi:hypothetical protein
MAPIPSDSKLSPLSVRAAADHAQLRAAAKAGYEGNVVADVPAAVKLREQRRSEREREAHKRHYQGTPQKPR